MDADKNKLSFKDYYKRFTELQVELRDRICTELEFSSTKTFYNKTNNDSWTNLERAAIENIITEFNIKLIDCFK
jgi:hypothetical protein